MSILTVYAIAIAAGAGIIGAGAGYAAGSSRAVASVAVACPTLPTIENTEKPFPPSGSSTYTKGKTW